MSVVVDFVRKVADAHSRALMNAARNTPPFPIKPLTEAGLEPGDNVVHVSGRFINGALIGTILRLEGADAYVDTVKSGAIRVPLSSLILAL